MFLTSGYGEERRSVLEQRWPVLDPNAPVPQIAGESAAGNDIGFGIEFLDDRIRGEHALIEAVDLPIMAEIPPLSTPKELRRAKWVPRLAIAATVVILILLPSGVAYVYYWSS